MPLVGGHRWVLVATAVLVESVGGLGYIFSVYSDRLKTEFGLAQVRLEQRSDSGSQRARACRLLGSRMPREGGPLALLGLAYVRGRAHGDEACAGAAS